MCCTPLYTNTNNVNKTEQHQPHKTGINSGNSHRVLIPSISWIPKAY